MIWPVLLFLSLAGNSLQPAMAGKPAVTYAGMVAPDVIAVTIQAQSVEHGKQIVYEPQSGDEIVTWRQHRYVRRGEARIGALVGLEGGIIQTPDRLDGDPLDTKVADQVNTYHIVSEPDDRGDQPETIFRKSKPVDCTRAPAKETSAMEHTLFLKLSNPLTVGRRYTVHFKQGLLAKDEVSFDFEPSRLRSEAVHVNQIGFRQAFVESMRGLYCQRSGIALGPPYTSFVRPRGFHPDDGVKVYVSEPHLPGEDESLRKLPPDLQALVDSFEPGQERFRKWMDNLTNRTLPNAWGGYMDAGDWDRRADHALMPLMMFDLAEMFPETFAQWKFNIPDSQDDLPDLINEALWEVDFLKRMQQDDGSVFGAIESGAHPRRGEASWQESLPVFAYARTPGVAYNYAAVASRAAHWFQTHAEPERVREYKDSALKAFAWAERQPGERDRNPRNKQGARRSSREDARCLAAAELYRLTGEEKWHEIFLSTTRFQAPDAPFLTSHLGHTKDPQGVAAWTYLLTRHASVNDEVQRNIRTALLREADRDVRFTEATDFHWSGGPGRRIAWGALSKPESQTLVRAHFLTGDKKYLRAIVLSTLSGAGANPVNMCYVTGVGTRWPQHPLHEDAYVSNQSLYEGVTIGGPIDPLSRNKHANAARFEKMLYPPARQWPATESYFDVFSYVPMNEFTVHQTMLPTSFVWGYLAARR